MSSSDGRLDGRRRAGRAAPCACPRAAGPDDLRELAVDRAGVPWQFGVLLVLDRPLDPAEVRRALADRVRAVPRLRRRLVRTPRLCGRPVCVDDPGFALERHVREVRCAGPLTDGARHDVAVRAIGTRLSLQRPPWEALVVTGTTADRGALVVVCHHVLVDGGGGFAALDALVDDGLVPGDPPAHDDGFPRPAPTAGRLFADALAGRARTLRHLAGGVRRIRDGLGELRAAQAPRPPRSSLNRPVGARRVLRVLRGDLGASVPIGSRLRTDATPLGNAVGAARRVAHVGSSVDPVAEVARRTATGRRRSRGASAAVLGPMIRLVAGVGVLPWIVDRQRSVTTFVTNLRGPQAPLTMLGARVEELVPITTTTGNVPVVFGALSYAGTLTLTVVADPDACPELDTLVGALRADLAALLAAPGTPDLGGSAIPADPRRR